MSHLRLLLTSVGLIALLSAMGSRVALSESLAAAETGSKAAGADEITRLVEGLDDPDFEVREASSRRLWEEGSQAIPALVEVALAKPPEAATRALHVLERHLRSEEKSRFEPADDALQKLADGERGFVAVGAASILARHSRLREKRAVAAIRELGGTVTYGIDRSRSQQWWGAAPGQADAESALRGLRPTSIVLRSDWRGGTEGLKYLRRLKHCRDLKLYVVRSSKVPLAEAQKLASALPGLDVQERGAYLGISGIDSVSQEICVVGQVLVDGPAGRAGLKERDVIRELNGESVSGFNDLIEKLKNYAAGERVTMTVERNKIPTGQRDRLTLDVELGTWDLPSLTSEAEKYLRDVKELEAARRELENRENEAGDASPAETFPPFER